MPTKSTRISQTRSKPLDRTVERLRLLDDAYTKRPLHWDDAVGLAEKLGLPVDVRRLRVDAALVMQMGRRRIIVSDRVYLPTWGVFCVLHELGHYLTHPGPRGFYLGSPGWMSKTESQANRVALLALAPPASDDREAQLLNVVFTEDTVTLHIAKRRYLDAHLAERWTSQKLTLQRYNPTAL